MRFGEVYVNWKKGSLTQEEAGRILGVSGRTFRRYIDSYDEDNPESIMDKRISKASHRRAPVDEVMRLSEQYKEKYLGWNVKHFYEWYSRDGGSRSYTWVKNTLQSKGLVKKAPGKGKHRKRRERAPVKGMLLHQDGSTHEWVKGKKWDLIVTMDDATTEHYSMFFISEEGTASSFRGIKEVIEQHGVFCSLYTDRGSHYWNTPKAGGKVDKDNITQFGFAMKQLGIEMIPAYSPQARGRSERMFATHQDRLVKELALHGITEMEEANRYIKEVYLPWFNQKFMVKAAVEGSVFVALPGHDLDNILCEQYERKVSCDNCVSFNGLCLQIPADQYRTNYVKVTVRVRKHMDGRLSIFHGPRKLAEYDEKGNALRPVARFASLRQGRALRVAFAKAQASLDE